MKEYKKYIYLIGIVLSLLCITASVSAADAFDGYVARDTTFVWADVVASGDAVATKLPRAFVKKGSGKAIELATVSMTMIADVGGGSTGQPISINQNIKRITCTECHALERNRPG